MDGVVSVGRGGHPGDHDLLTEPLSRPILESSLLGMLHPSGMMAPSRDKACCSNLLLVISVAPIRLALLRVAQLRLAQPRFALLKIPLYYCMARKGMGLDESVSNHRTPHHLEKSAVDSLDTSIHRLPW